MWQCDGHSSPDLAFAESYYLESLGHLPISENANRSAKLRSHQVVSSVTDKL